MSAKHGANWHGGRSASGHGYIRIWKPDHPRASAKGYVYEHILVAEQALGRMLPRGAEVHHIDDNGSNNAPNNLVVCPSRAYHKLLHQRQRALDACGNASAHRCHFCQSYDRQDAIVVAPRHRGGKTYEQSYHEDCRRTYHAARRTA